MDGRSANEIGTSLKRDVDLAHANLIRRKEELEAALGDISSSEDYGKDLIRSAEAGLAAATEERDYALQRFQVFLKTAYRQKMVCA